MSSYRFITRRLVGFLFAAFFAVVAQAQDKPLSLKVYTANDLGFLVVSTLVMGKQDAILIDCQFNFANAHRVVADILESGKALKTVYITHGHPDHYFGVEVIKQAFPGARVVALETTVADIRQSAQKKIDTWSPQLGPNGPKSVVIPEALGEKYLELEGQRLELIGPVQGDSENNSIVWIPSIKTIVAGDTVFGGVHAWTADSNAEQRKAWIKTLDRMEAMGPEKVVPGHYRNGTAMDVNAIRFTRDYLEAFDKAAASAANSTDLIAAMEARYPDATLTPALQIGSKVNKGEMKW
jgi:glyoxylase-like metal-dependent hydrolase (beta-lactamase superfamily II)